MPAEAATGLRRGLAVLFTLASDEAATDGGLRVARRAELVEQHKSQTSRSLKTLVEC